MDSSKTEHILKWPQPQSAKEVYQFLGLVHYVLSSLPQIMEHTNFDETNVKRM